MRSSGCGCSGGEAAKAAGGCGCGGRVLEGDGANIVFFPKYTTLIGDVATGYVYYSEVYDVTDFNRLELEIRTVNLAGQFQAGIEVSSDGQEWTKPAGSHVTVTATGVRTSLQSELQRYVRATIESWNATTDIACIEMNGHALND